MRDIFLSYARKDYQAATVLFAEFQKHGLTVWFDVRESIFGDPLNEELKTQIELSQYFVAFVTERWKSSRHCRYEFQIRFDHVTAHKLPMNSFLLVPAKPRISVLSWVREKVFQNAATQPEKFEVEKFVHLQGNDIGLSAQQIIKHIEEDGPAYVERCAGALIEGWRAEEHSHALARAMARYPTISTINTLWNTAITTKYPTTCIDLTVGALHHGMREVEDVRLHLRCIELIEQSIASGNRILIDKFAYAAGNLCIYTSHREQHDISKRYAELIDVNADSTEIFVSQAYVYTRTRVNDWLRMVNSAAQQRSN